MNPYVRIISAVGALGLFAMASVSDLHAQTAGPAAQAGQSDSSAGSRGRAPAEFWYVNKKNSIAYTPPNRPLWKLSDLLKEHDGQNNWSQEVLKDDYQDVTYNSAAPGTHVASRMHMETATVYVIVRGAVRFTVEGQAPVVATRGGIVNILNDTVYSYDVEGSQNALWVNINPRGYGTVYPANEAPPPSKPGTSVAKVAFSHSPPAYSGTNKLYTNVFDEIAQCQSIRFAVDDDHIFVNPLLGWLNPADNKCGGDRPQGNVGDKGLGSFDPNSVFGHLHHSVREWWIVQSGAISGKFEQAGQFHAAEGDILNAEVDAWHQMGAEGKSGPSIRTAISAYRITNMFNTEAPRRPR